MKHASILFIIFSLLLAYSSAKYVRLGSHSFVQTAPAGSYVVHSTVYFDSPFPAGIVPSVSVSYSKMTNGQLVWTGELFAHSISNTQFTVTSFQYSPGLTHDVGISYIASG